jgi:hypothetical protein
MELVKELAAIPKPLSTPPSMTVARQPNLSTNALQKGPVDNMHCSQLNTQYNAKGKGPECQG